METFRDVVETVKVIENREAAAESARQTVKWLSAIVDTTGDAVITSDTSIRITGFDRGAGALTGYSRWARDSIVIDRIVATLVGIP